MYECRKLVFGSDQTSDPRAFPSGIANGLVRDGIAGAFVEHLEVVLRARNDQRLRRKTSHG